MNQYTIFYYDNGSCVKTVDVMAPAPMDALDVMIKENGIVPALLVSHQDLDDSESYLDLEKVNE